MFVNNVVARDLPPSGEELYNNLDTMLVEKRFDEVKPYLRKLENQYPGYIPTRLARATYHYVDGAQVEKMLVELQNLRAQLLANPALASPAFLEVIESHMQRFGQYKEAFDQHDVSPKERKKRHAVEKRTPSRTTGKIWCCEGLFYFSPAVSYPAKDKNPLRLYKNTEFIADAPNVNVLVSIVKDKKVEDNKKISAIVLLGQQRSGIDKVIQLLLNILNDPLVNWRVGEAAAEALGGYGAEAAKVLIPHLQTDQGSALKLTLWSLALIGAEAKDAIDPLQSFVANYNGLNPTFVTLAEMALASIKTDKKRMKQ
ncbi:HEAT repeat domain-containing protein [Kaarinaea lacus]